MTSRMSLNMAPYKYGRYYKYVMSMTIVAPLETVRKVS